MRFEFTSEKRAESFRRALDRVSRERRYLLFVEAPGIGGTRRFLRDIVEKGWTQFLVIDGDEVAGWCDVIPGMIEGTRHVGHLGMGVVSEYRRRGIGARLLEMAVADAFSKRIERIELEVFASNEGAVALYRNAGFELEGRKRRARRLDGRDDDILVMGLLKAEDERA